ncbi:MAG: HAD hydrolase-like protein [Desulfobacterales bacterium]|nr:HAD hydrolase-like protein [Desulfobacterales bacterium]
MKHIFFDLDGTLTDPRLGIVRCIQYALSSLNIPRPPESDLEGWIGPPLRDSFLDLFDAPDEALASEAVKLYRERFARKGMFENQVYPGVEELLRSLLANKRALYVVTSKPGVFAEKIVDYFNLGSYFKKVYGSELDGTRSQKTELIRHVLEEEKIAANQAVMIGDRKYDIIGAKENDVTGIGVSWGYGSAAELEEAGAAVIFDSPSELLAGLIWDEEREIPPTSRSG